MFRSNDGPYSHVQSYLKQGKLLADLEQLVNDFNIQTNEIINHDRRATREIELPKRRMTADSLIRKYQDYWQIRKFIRKWLLNQGMKPIRASINMFDITTKLASKLKEMHHLTNLY